MLVIRLARTGKKHQAYFRIAVADSKKTPTAKFVEIIGNYDPHAKKITVNKERLDFYLKNGAQPSNSVAKLLKNEKITLPKWVKITEKKRAPKKAEEPKEEVVPAKPEAEKTEEPQVEADQAAAEIKEETPENTEEKAEEAPKEEGQVETKEESPEENKDAAE